MKKNFVIVFLLCAISLYAVWNVGSSILEGMDYSVESKKASPSGRYVLYEVHSRSEGGHAPYGQHLVLSSGGQVRQPNDGYVVFAGYCIPRVAYSWTSDVQITITCKSNEKTIARTKVEVVQGIKVDVKYEK
jgi:hypothetical protein